MEDLHRLIEDMEDPAEDARGLDRADVPVLGHTADGLRAEVTRNRGPDQDQTAKAQGDDLDLVQNLGSHLEVNPVLDPNHKISRLYTLGCQGLF